MSILWVVIATQIKNLPFQLYLRTVSIILFMEDYTEEAGSTRLPWAPYILRIVCPRYLPKIAPTVVGFNAVFMIYGYRP